MAFSALGILMATQGRDIESGIWFGLACSLKPHLAAFLVLYYLVRFRWRLFVAALATTGAITLVAIAWLQIRGVAWFQDYLRNLRGFATQNRIDDFTTANPIRFLLINLQVPFYSFTGSARSANLLAFTIGGLLVCAWIYLCFRNRQDQMSMLGLGSVAVISLLPVYHRSYDATLLVIPLSWCLSHPLGKRGTLTKYALLDTLVRRGRIPLSWSSSWWWDRFLMPHENWLLLILSLLLLALMAKHTADENIASPPALSQVIGRNLALE